MQPTSPRTRVSSIRSPADPDDSIYEHIARGSMSTYVCEVPAEFDLRDYATPIRDQGARGSCAAFTASAIREVHEKLETNFTDWMSPEFIYYHRSNKPADGMYGRNVFQILQHIGSVPEADYPYCGDHATPTKPNKRLYEIAARYKISNFARVTTVDGLKRALVELGACYLLLPQYRTRPQFWRATGAETTSISHAITVVGYTLEGFILRNSWGSTWNGDGHVIFPYADWPCHYECWTTVDIADTPVVKRKKKCTVS